MTRSYRILSTGTALALVLGVSPATSQTYQQLSGIMLPACGGEGDPVDAGTLTEESFASERPVPPLMVDAANQRGEICINAEGEVELSGESARLAGTVEAAPAAEPAIPVAPAADPEAPAGSFGNVAAEANADADADAPADPEAAAAETAEPEEPAGEGVADAPAEPEAPASIGEIAQDLLNQQTGGAAVENPDGPKTVEAPAVEPEPEPEPAPPVAAAAGADDGREAEPAEVSETVVTEENSRSSSEEFRTPEQTAAASEAKSGGLSNFEKFALGAAGIVALDAIIGRNSEVVSNTGDRVVVRRSDGDLEVLRDDDTLLRRPGSEVRTETFSDGSTRTTVTRRNGARIVTIADASGRVIKRTRFAPDGREIVIIDDTEEEVQPVDVTRLPPPAPERRVVAAGDRSALEAALQAEARSRVDRRFTLRQVRQYRQVRDLMPEINIDAINFATGSAAIPPDEAEELFDLGQAMSEFIAENPDELFLVEGHTDAVGDPVYNLALSDRRAESVALALAEYFNVPPENMIIQGYGESELLVPTTEAERANRRAVVRRVTPLLR